MNKEEYESSFFNQIVRDAIKDINSGGSGYCFSIEQVNKVKEEIPNIQVREDDGIFYLKGERSYVSKKKKDRVPSSSTN